MFARKLFPICLHYSIVFKAKHIPGVCNKLADAPSCLQVHTFKQLAPAYMDPFPTASELSNIVTMLASSSLYSLPRF